MVRLIGDWTSVLVELPLFVSSASGMSLSGSIRAWSVIERPVASGAFTTIVIVCDPPAGNVPPMHSTTRLDSEHRNPPVPSAETNVVPAGIVLRTFTLNAMALPMFFATSV